MATITDITADYARQLLNYNPETGRLRRVLTSGQLSNRYADSQKRNGYRYVKLKGRRYAAHQLVWLLHYGVAPCGIVDHVNRDRQDNRVTNLRVVTAAENAQNAGIRADNASGYRGVCWHKRTKTWQVRIRAQGEHKFVGHFRVLSEAIEARREAEQLLHI